MERRCWSKAAHRQTGAPPLGHQDDSSKHRQVSPPRAIGLAAERRHGSLSRARLRWQILKNSLPEFSKSVHSNSTSASCLGSIPQLSCASPKSAKRNGRKPPRARLNWSRTHAGERARTPWHDASGCTLRTERHGHPLNLRRNRFVASCKLELVVARNLNRLPAAFCARHPPLASSLNPP